MITIDLSKSFEDRIIDENLQAVESPAFSDLVFFAYHRGLLFEVLRKKGISLSPLPEHAPRNKLALGLLLVLDYLKSTFQRCINYFRAE